jgi:hypothetical protein
VLWNRRVAEENGNGGGRSDEQRRGKGRGMLFGKRAGRWGAVGGGSVMNEGESETGDGVGGGY